MSKQAKKNRELISKILCGFFVFSLVFVNLGFTSAKHSSEKLVYCPLQKTWVESNIPAQKSINLNDICASDRTKLKIAWEISLKNLASREITENVVFDYLEKGSSVLQNIPQDFPSQKFAQTTKSQSVSGNYPSQDIFKPSSCFASEQLARPPSFVAKSYFPPRIDNKLSRISRNINPRSPPFSI